MLTEVLSREIAAKNNISSSNIILKKILLKYEFEVK